MFTFLMTNVMSYLSLLLLQWIQSKNLPKLLSCRLFFRASAQSFLFFSKVLWHVWHCSITVFSLKIQHSFLLDFIMSHSSFIILCYFIFRYCYPPQFPEVLDWNIPIHPILALCSLLGLLLWNLGFFLKNGQIKLLLHEQKKIPVISTSKKAKI